MLQQSPCTLLHQLTSLPCHQCMKTKTIILTKTHTDSRFGRGKKPMWFKNCGLWYEDFAVLTPLILQFLFWPIANHITLLKPKIMFNPSKLLATCRTVIKVCVNNLILELYTHNRLAPGTFKRLPITSMLYTWQFSSFMLRITHLNDNSTLVITKVNFFFNLV